LVPVSDGHATQQEHGSAQLLSIKTFGDIERENLY